jgi:hypothetical protein
MKRPAGKLLDDIIQAAEVADEIVRRGRANFESDPVAQEEIHGPGRPARP